MIDQLSPAAQRALGAARLRARRRGAADVAPEDLLAGLFSDPDSAAGRMLAERARLPADFAIEPGDEPLPPPPLDPHASHAVALAVELALGVANALEAGTEELLLATLEAWGAGAAAFCGRHALPAAAFRQEYEERFADLRQPLPVPEGEARLELADVAERADAARLIDANANRCREALRVIEDYARFVLDDRGLCERLKRCRHGLRDALAYFPPDWLLAARDTLADVGASIDVAGEFSRARLVDVVAANCKRAQEACRAMEEAAKLDDSQAARQLELLRYEMYTLEKALLTAAESRRRLHPRTHALYWLLEPDACAKSLEWTVQEALEAGVRMVQLREKRLAGRALAELARDLRRWTAAAGALLIVNDRPDLARIVGADGCHVGQDDFTVKDVRRALGPDALVGVSTHAPADLRRAVEQGANYVGAGPVFPSRTKAFAAFPGLDYIRHVSAATALPAYPIGGLDADNAKAVLDAGATRLCVGRAITASADPARVVRSLLGALAAA